MFHENKKRVSRAYLHHFFHKFGYLEVAHTVLLQNVTNRNASNTFASNERTHGATFSFCSWSIEKQSGSLLNSQYPVYVRSYFFFLAPSDSADASASPASSTSACLCNSSSAFRFDARTGALIRSVQGSREGSQRLPAGKSLLQTCHVTFFGSFSRQAQSQSRHS